MKKTRKIALTGVFGAIIFVMTFFAKIPVASGYVHFGDAMIYLCAGFIAGPWAMLAGAVGAVLADIMGGYIMYAPSTAIIKSLIAVPFIIAYRKNEKLFSPITAVFTIPAGLLTVGGYFVTDMIINKTYAFVNIPTNAVQAVVSAVLFVIMAIALDKLKVKKRIK